jgi:inosine-uridine nucleoside N-ribohydrolase
MEPAIKEKIVVVWLGGTPQYWPSAREFNLRQDVIASQVLFDRDSVFNDLFPRLAGLL